MEMLAAAVPHGTGAVNAPLAGGLTTASEPCEASHQPPAHDTAAPLHMTQRPSPRTACTIATPPSIVRARRTGSAWLQQCTMPAAAHCME